MVTGSWVPDFAIVGAPKCGTTSIYSALERHPEICMSYIKEPQFFATDLPGYRDIKDHRTYRRLFRRQRHQRVDGESSTLYLFSRDALPEMLRIRPDFKVIAVVRNPIEVFQSLHNEFLKELTEDEPDLETAWNLQDRREQGLDIPWRCNEPRLLQYRKVCSLGDQVRRLMDIVPPEQRLILTFDDLTSRPAECLQRIFALLGVADRSRANLPWANAFARPRSVLVSDVVRLAHTNPLLNGFQVLAKPTLNRFGITPVVWLLKLNLEKIPKPNLRPEFRALLNAEFAEDVALLERLLDRQLPHWLDRSSASVAAAGKAAS